MNSSKIVEDLGNGPAVILLHGFPFNRSMWREQIEFLSERGYRCIAPDLRGLGENKSDDEIATIDDMARDVAALMDELKIDRAIICGLSMGCYVAFEFARLLPSRVEALVLAGARAEGADKAEKKSREQQANRVLEQGMAHAIDFNFAEPFVAAHARGQAARGVARARNGHEHQSTRRGRGAAGYGGTARLPRLLAEYSGTDLDHCRP